MEARQRFTDQFTWLSWHVSGITERSLAEAPLSYVRQLSYSIERMINSGAPPPSKMK